MATRYKNGMVPASALVQIDGEPYHFTSPKGLAMWHALKRNVQRDHGVTLRITAGKNAYRDMAGQEFARSNACAAGNCNSAALPGWSSHGGTWIDSVYTGGQWVDAMAFDIDNWAELGEAEFFRQARAVGFLADAITVARAGHREPWHLVVLSPWGPIPASLESEQFNPASREEEDEEMARAGFQFKAANKAQGSLVIDTTSGFYTEWYSGSATYNSNAFKGFGIDPATVTEITLVHRSQIIADCRNTRAGK